VPMVLTASTRREASSAFAQREWRETLTEEDVSAISLYFFKCYMSFLIINYNFADINVCLLF
jgi:hypothetical protein